MKKAKLYLPQYMIFIYYLGNEKIIGRKLAHKMKTMESTAYYIKKALLKEKIIMETTPNSKRDKPIMLTSKGKKMYEGVLNIVEALGINMDSTRSPFGLKNVAVK